MSPQVNPCRDFVVIHSFDFLKAHRLLFDGSPPGTSTIIQTDIKNIKISGHEKTSFSVCRSFFFSMFFVGVSGPEDIYINQ